jgi:proteasome lid subunit RPN8/RPN11
MGLAPEVSSMVIARKAFNAIFRHAKAESPCECCGLLLGGNGKIESALPARNDSNDPSRYRVNPEDHFSAIHAARSLGNSVIGVYHSHLHSEAVPSVTDLTEASYPDYLYVIVSLHSGTADAIEPGIMGGFWLRDGSATAVELRVD